MRMEGGDAEMEARYFVRFDADFHRAEEEAVGRERSESGILAPGLHSAAVGSAGPEGNLLRGGPNLARPEADIPNGL